MEDTHKELSREQLQAILKQREERELQEDVSKLEAILVQLNLEIAAIPQFTNDGRVTAIPLVRRRQAQ